MIISTSTSQELERKGLRSCGFPDEDARTLQGLYDAEHETYVEQVKKERREQKVVQRCLILSLLVQSALDGPLDDIRTMDPVWLDNIGFVSCHMQDRLQKQQRLQKKRLLHEKQLKEEAEEVDKDPEFVVWLDLVQKVTQIYAPTHKLGP